MLRSKISEHLIRRALQTLPSPVVHGPESWSRGTAASDSRGHRDRQQTRQLRVLTLLFSIINEQESKQIRTKGGWGIPVYCLGVERYRLGLTHTELLRCEVEVCFSPRPLAWRNVTLNTSIMCLEVQRTGFADLKALPPNTKLSQTSTAMSAEPLNRRSLYISVICWWHQ